MEYDESLSPEENIARGLFEIASAIRWGAKELGKEGAPGMGAIEFLAVKVAEGSSSIANAIDSAGR